MIIQLTEFDSDNLKSNRPIFISASSIVYFNSHTFYGAIGTQYQYTTIKTAHGFSIDVKESPEYISNTMWGITKQLYKI